MVETTKTPLRERLRSIALWVIGLAAIVFVGYTVFSETTVAVLKFLFFDPLVGSILIVLGALVIADWRFYKLHKFAKNQNGNPDRVLAKAFPTAQNQLFFAIGLIIFGVFYPGLVAVISILINWVLFLKYEQIKRFCFDTFYWSDEGNHKSKGGKDLDADHTYKQWKVYYKRWTETVLLLSVVTFLGQLILFLGWAGFTIFLLAFTKFAERMVKPLLSTEQEASTFWKRAIIALRILAGLLAAGSVVRWWEYYLQALVDAVTNLVYALPGVLINLVYVPLLGS